METDRAYLSILGWPSGFDVVRRVEAMVACAGMGPYIAGQMAKRRTPAIVHMFDSVLRDEVIGAFHKVGVLALAPARSDVRAYPTPIEPGELARFPGERSFAVRERGGGAWTFRVDDVRLIVAGTVRHVGKVRRHSDGSPNYAGWTTHYGLTNNYGAAAQEAIRDAETAGWGTGTSRNTRAIEIVDIHVLHESNPRLIRLSGAGTRIGTVGEERQRPSLLDQHKPVEEIAEHMPGVPIETGFDAFNTPSDVEGMADAAGQGSSRLNPVAFHFYSVWSALIHRGVRGW